MFQTILLILIITTITATTQKNVVFLIADDLNVWIKPYINDVRVDTPFFSTFHNFTVFKSMHAAVPICHASRTALWYGLDSRVTNILYNGDEYYTPNATIFATLTNAGYDVIGFGKLFHSWFFKDSLKNGEFAYYPGASTTISPGNWPIMYSKTVNDSLLINSAHVYYYPDDFEMNEMFWYDYYIKDLLAGNLKHGGNRPFALFIGIGKPHEPFYIPNKYVDKINNIPPPDQNITHLSEYGKNMVNDTLQSTAFNLYADFNNYSIDHRRTYKALVKYVDSFVGKVYNSLKNGPFSENTHFFFTSDHGYSNGDGQWYGKMVPWRRITQVPFYYWHGSNTKTTSRWDHHSLIDVYPTILNLLDIPVPNGVSLNGKAISMQTVTTNSFAVTQTKVPGFITNGLYWGIYHWIEFVDTTTSTSQYEIYSNTVVNIDETENVYTPTLSDTLKTKYLAFTATWTPAS